MNKTMLHVTRMAVGLMISTHVLRHWVQNIVRYMARFNADVNLGGRHISPVSVTEVASEMQQVLNGIGDGFEVKIKKLTSLGQSISARPHQSLLWRIRVAHNGHDVGEVLLVSWQNCIDDGTFFEVVENCMEYRQWAHWHYGQGVRKQIRCQKKLLTMGFLDGGVIAPLVERCDTSNFVRGKRITDVKGLKKHLFKTYIANPNLPEPTDDTFTAEELEMEAGCKLYDILLHVTNDR